MYHPLFIAYSLLLERAPVAIVERNFVEAISDIVDSTIVCLDGKKQAELNQSQILYPQSYVLWFIFKSLEKLHCNNILNSPDYCYYAWGVPNFHKMCKLLETTKFDYIQTFSNPQSSHLLGLKLKEKFNIPWVAHFFDPWYDNPYREITNSFFKKIDFQREQKIAQYADIIIHDSEQMKQEWIQRYGDVVKNKIHVLPLSFNPPKNDLKSEQNIVRDKVVISHIGNFSRLRNSSTFLEALASVLQMDKNLSKQIVVNFVGDVTSLDKSLIIEYGLSDVINLVGVISEEECKHYYQSSDLFLVIDADSDRNIFFPSKIMKYFYYAKPILGITTPNSVLDYELKESGNFCFYHRNKKSLIDFLYSFIKNKKIYNGFDKNYWKKFSKENISYQYYQIISKLNIK